MRRLLLLTAAALLFSACTPRRIPGTEIDDTAESRKIIGVMEEYRKAVEREDPEAIIALLTEDFRDNGGTGAPGDDVDRDRLKAELPERFAKLENIRLELTVKKLAVELDTATATYNYSYSFQFGAEGKPQSDADIKQMVLKRKDDKWKIESGI